MDLHDIALNTELPEEQLLEDLPPIIPNSELQLDGDISCYYCSWPDNSLASDISNLKRHIEVKRLLAACEIVQVHTTRGRKAGREDIALVKQYQATRVVADPEKKKRVEELRHFLGTYHSNTVMAQPQWNIEADDSMSIAQRQCIAHNKVSKIMTVDKDLDMVPGIHINYDTYEEKIHPDGFGKLWIEERGELKSKGGNGITRKLKGNGTGFLWAQVLMGDTADNIPGLPKITGRLLNNYKPTKQIITAHTTLVNPKATPTAKRKARQIIEERKPLGCGPAMAYLLLKDCTTDLQAMRVIKEAYQDYYGRVYTFTTWEDQQVTKTSTEMVLEQARLLWMLRTIDDDVSKFITEIINRGD